jgi:hypothetical protein
MSVSFPFKEEISFIFGNIKRPIATVDFYNVKQDEWRSVAMIVDSGADFTLLPYYISTGLNIDLDKDTKKTYTKGVGGTQIVYLTKKPLQIKIGQYKRLITVAFLDNNNIPPLLGRYSFMETFKVTFENFTTTFS